MTISYLGHAAFKIKGSNGTLVFNPYGKSVVGESMKKTSSDIVLTSIKDSEEYAAIDRVTDNPYVISGPGEYEVKEMMVIGFRQQDPKDKESYVSSNNVIYRVEVDGVNICHLGAITTKLTSEDREKLGDVHVLMLPVGGGDTIESKLAAQIVNEIEPAIVLPCRFQDVNGNALTKGLEDVQKFIDALGVVAERDQVTLKLKDLDFNNIEDSGSRIVVLNK